MRGITWNVAGVLAILSVCNGARNYADYDHGYTDALEEPSYVISPWLMAVLVSICVVVVAIIVLLIVCCFCCSTRHASPNRIAHTVESGTITLTAITHQVYPKNVDYIGRTNPAFEETTLTTETGQQISTSPPPYTERPDIKT